MADLVVPTPDEIKSAANARGLSVAALFRHADIDSSTFYRWKRGRIPPVKVIQKLLDTIDAAPAKEKLNGR